MSSVRRATPRMPSRSSRRVPAGPARAREPPADRGARTRKGDETSAGSRENLGTQSSSSTPLSGRSQRPLCSCGERCGSRSGARNAAAGVASFLVRCPGLLSPSGHDVDVLRRRVRPLGRPQRPRRGRPVRRGAAHPTPRQAAHNGAGANPDVRSLVECRSRGRCEHEASSSANVPGRAEARRSATSRVVSSRSP